MKIPENDLRIKRDRLKLEGKKSVGKTGGASAKAKTGQGSSDKTAISSDVQVLNQAIESVLATPELSRSEKVRRIKQGIEDGSLQYHSRDVAEKILKDLLKETEFLG